MSRPANEIIADIEHFQPKNGNWLPLGALVEELFQSGAASQAVDALLGVFERYPNETGAEVFNLIVRGLEGVPGYELKVVQSLRRVPSECGLMLVDRLLVAGHKEVEGVRLLPLVAQIANDPKASAVVRQEAQEILSENRYVEEM